MNTRPLLSAATDAAFDTKTRGKILRSSLVLFNSGGFERATTSQIAETANVLEGTLWYHFKAKQDLVIAHLEAFEESLKRKLSAPAASALPNTAEQFLGIFETLWDFRYLLRDPLAALQEGEVLLRLQQTYRSIEQSVEQRLRHADKLGLLDLSGTDIPALAVSCVVSGRYWLDYARIRYADLPDANRDRQQGIDQMLGLLRPYFTDKTQQLIAERDPLKALGVT